MIERPFWIRRITDAWSVRSLIWLSGSRRAGKTTLSKMLGKVIYMNCDLPSVNRKLEDPEAFYDSTGPDSKIIFDEIHRLEDPSRVLKIGTDEYPDRKILATGSSTLDASKKFSDSLTGRKSSIYLPPVIWDECREIFGITDLDHRILCGGLPEPLLSKKKDPGYFSEWFDSFFARDIQELFNIRNRAGYLRMMHLIYRSSGNLLDYTQLSKKSGLSRPTVMTYLESLLIAHNISMIPPFHGGGKREITARPKVYAFDTGFVTFVNGWNELRDEDKGLLWEHLVLDMIRAYLPAQKVFFWRDKSGREIDFIIPKYDGNVDIIECKISPDHISTVPIQSFRELYPGGLNICYSPYLREPYSTRIKNLRIEFIGTLKEYVGRGQAQ